MIRLHYNKKVGSSDEVAREHAKLDITGIRNNQDGDCWFGNMTYLTEWQLAIKNGVISADNLEVIFPDGIMRFENDGTSVG